MTTIETARLTLRRARRDDLDAVHSIMSDARAMRYWSTLPHESRAVTEPWFEAQFFSGDPARDDGSEPPLDAVAHDGTADSFGDDETDSRRT